MNWITTGHGTDLCWYLDSPRTSPTFYGPIKCGPFIGGVCTFKCITLMSHWYELISPWTKWPPFHRRHFQMHFLNEKFCISISISLKFVPKGPINNKSALVQVMALCRTGDKPLPEPMLAQFTDAYICNTRGRWVNVSLITGNRTACSIAFLANI